MQRSRLHRLILMAGAWVVLTHPMAAEDSPTGPSTPAPAHASPPSSGTSTPGAPAASATNLFVTTVTPFPTPGPDTASGAGAQDSSMCWSGGATSWSRQGQHQASSASALSSDPLLATRTAEFLNDITSWRAFVAAQQYAQAQASFAHARQTLDDLAHHGIRVTEQMAFTNKEHAHCLLCDAITRLAAHWPSSGEESVILVQQALVDQPGDPLVTQALDAANTATGEHHGRLAMIQVASIGQHMDQLAAHLLADNQEVARLTAAGDDAGARARMQDATDTLNACYQDSKALIPLEQEARLSYQRSLGSAKLMLTRAQESELAHHALTTFGVPESAALVASETALLAAADSGLARDYLLLGTPARGLPLAREALLLVPDSKPYHDLCVQLENTASVPH